MMFVVIVCPWLIVLLNTHPKDCLIVSADHVDIISGLSFQLLIFFKMLSLLKTQSKERLFALMLLAMKLENTRKLWRVTLKIGNIIDRSLSAEWPDLFNEIISLNWLNLESMVLLYQNLNEHKKLDIARECAQFYRIYLQS